MIRGRNRWRLRGNTNYDNLLLMATITLELFELKNICMDMAELGAAACERKRSPALDEIKQREAFRWLKSLGHEPKLLSELEQAGLVHKRRKGTAVNSPFIYSKFELQAALNSLRMGRYVNKPKPNQ